MAANEWIGGYVDAILDSGAIADDISRTATAIGADKEALTAAKYFINEVTGHDDIALYRTWIKDLQIDQKYRSALKQAQATKYPQERGSRMEYLCWRIWHIARKKRQMEWEDAQRLARHHVERERGQQEPADEMSCEDLSEGEKERVETTPHVPDRPKGSEHAQGSDLAPTQSIIVKKRLYMVLISLHGLVRGENMELGRDSDTGGQVKYVVELARALALMPEVYRVDLLTRQICDPKVDCSYGEPTEMLTARSYYDGGGGEFGESSGAYIIRIPCGPRDQYIRKELLWPYIHEFVDTALVHILNMAKVLGEQITGGESVWPHVIHGHYADAGNCASLLSGALGVPMVLTGHSLGLNKLEQLLKERQSTSNINQNYKIMRRIEAEEMSLDASELVITSTRHEIDEQWGLYDGFNVKTERTLRWRARRGISCHGRFMPRMVVIPPGMDFSNVIVQDPGDVVDDAESLALTGSDGSMVVPLSPRSEPPIWGEIMRFFTNPHKPMILALARPDPKKNITSLVASYGECRALRELANLTLIMGNRDEIDSMAGANADVLLQVLKLVDKYDLYGLVAYPKHHKQSEVPDIYRLAAKTKGVFINPALVEPFGLTLIEAAAHGLPTVATKNGGPVDIVKALNNGLLLDPHNQKEISEALLKLLGDRNLWIACQRNGLKNIHRYSWPEHCRTYLSKIIQCRTRHPQWQKDTPAAVDADDLDSQGDSLRDLKDARLCLSLDSDRGNGSEIETILSKDECSKEKLSAKSSAKKRNETHFEEGKYSTGRGDGPPYTPLKSNSLLRKRKRLAVIALDIYDASGRPTSDLNTPIQNILKAIRADPASSGTGVILSTALSTVEAVNILTKGGISMQNFDAVVSTSGSELYYPVGSEEIGADGGLQADPDYDSHIDYRWGGEALRETLRKVTASDTTDFEGTRALIEDVESFKTHCFTYNVLQPSMVPTVDRIRQRLRQRGLRCHVLYCRNETKMRVIPLSASRSQALRYLFVRWGLDVANMIVFVGEVGDTDHEDLLCGAHKTVVVKGVATKGCDRLLRAGGSFHKGDVAPLESPNILTTGHEVDQLSNVWKKLSSSAS